MHALYELQQTIVENLNYNEEFTPDKAARKSNIIQPLLSCLGWDINNPNIVKTDYSTIEGLVDYAFFEENKLIGFILVTHKHWKETINKAKAIGKAENIGASIITDGDIWNYHGKQETHCFFYIDDRNHTEKFIPHILHLSPNNIVDLGNHINLIIETDRKKRLVYDWQEFNKEENIQKIIGDLFFKFRGQVDIRNQDIDFTNQEIKDFFEKLLSVSIKEGSTPSTILKVIMPDGKIIFHKNGNQVLIDTINYIGIEHILKDANVVVGLKPKGNNSNEQLRLIEKEPCGKSQKVIEVGDEKYYIYTGASNEMKIKQLNRLSKELGIDGMQVEQLVK